MPQTSALAFIAAAFLAAGSACNFDPHRVPGAGDVPGSMGSTSPTGLTSEITQDAWSGGTTIGGTPSSDPAIASWAPGRFDLFYLSSTGTLRHRWFQNTWSTEEDLGGQLSSAPAAVSWGSGRIDIFARGTAADGTQNVLMHLWFNSGWGTWESLGGTLTSGPGAASWQPGRLDVFYANASHALGHIWFDNNAWQPHEQLGTDTFVGSPAAVSWASGRIDVVARGTASGNPLVHKWFNGAWQAWETLGGSMASNPAVASWGINRLDVFYLNASGALMTQWFDPSLGSWHAESSRGGSYTGSPGAVSWGGQRIDVAVLDPTAGVVQRTWLPDGTRDVRTQHNDNYRSGAQLFETALTPATVNSTSFGQLYTLPVTGKVYAQPLYVENVSTASGTKNLLYVATLENNIYAFDADASTPTVIWSRLAGTSFETPTPNDGNLNFGAGHDPSIGILATPAVDRGRNALYLTDSTGSGTAKVFHVNALDLATGADLMPAVAVGGTAANPSTFVDSASGTTTIFNSLHQLNRPGLLLANGLVYVAFGSSMDASPFHGWVFAHSADTLAQVMTYTTTGATRSGGGVWQSGNGLAADEHGAVVFMSGNGEGAAVSSPERQENSFVKLSGTTFQVLGQYWPHDTSTEFQLEDGADLDLGSGGALLVPGQDVIVGGGKPGKMYVLDRGLSQRQAAFQAFTNTWVSNPPSDYQTQMTIAPNIHGSPIYWQTSDPTISYFYAWSEKDALKAFPLNRHTLGVDTSHILSSSVRSQVSSMPGGMLSLSANGTTAHTGIVWAVVEDPVDTCSAPSGESAGGDCAPASTCNALCFTMPGYFYAFDAETLAPLFSTPVTRYSKFTPPTIANGKVFLATSNNEVLVYGLH